MKHSWQKTTVLLWRTIHSVHLTNWDGEVKVGVWEHWKDVGPDGTSIVSLYAELMKFDTLFRCQIAVFPYRNYQEKKPLGGKIDDVSCLVTCCFVWCKVITTQLVHNLYSDCFLTVLIKFTGRQRVSAWGEIKLNISTWLSDNWIYRKASDLKFKVFPSQPWHLKK